MFERIFRSKKKGVLFAVVKRSAHTFLVMRWVSGEEHDPQPVIAFSDLAGAGDTYANAQLTVTPTPKADAIACAERNAAAALR